MFKFPFEITFPKELYVQENPILLDTLVDKILRWYIENNPIYTEKSNMYTYESRSLYYSVVIEKIAETFEKMEEYTTPDFSQEKFFTYLPQNALNVLIPKYPKELSFPVKEKVVTLNLSSNGQIYYIDNNEALGMAKESIISLTLTKFIRLLKNKNMDQKIIEYLDQVVRETEFNIEASKKAIEATLYRLIERGGPIDGPRRGWNFAKMFKQKADTIIKYGLSDAYYDSKKLIEKYLKNGGSENTICYFNYFKLQEYAPQMSVKEILEMIDQKNVRTRRKNNESN